MINNHEYRQLLKNIPCKLTVYLSPPRAFRMLPTLLPFFFLARPVQWFIPPSAVSVLPAPFSLCSPHPATPLAFPKPPKACSWRSGSPYLPPRTARRGWSSGQYFQCPLASPHINLWSCGRTLAFNPSLKTHSASILRCVPPTGVKMILHIGSVFSIVSLAYS